MAGLNMTSPQDGVFVLDHPLASARLTNMRAKTTSSADFRAGVRDLGMFLGWEACRDLKTQSRTVQTPLMEYDGVQVGEKVRRFRAERVAGFHAWGGEARLSCSAA